MQTAENAETTSESVTAPKLTKEQHVIQLLEAGITATREVVEKLHAAGIEVAANYVDSIRAEWRKGQKLTPVRDGVVRTSPRKAIPPTAMVVHPGRSGEKKSVILELYNGGLKEPAKIKTTAAEQGVELSMNYIYVVLGELKKERREAPAPRGRKPGTKSMASPKVPTVTPSVAPQEGDEGIDANLLKLMQAAGLKFGIRQVARAAEFVNTHSARMIANVFAS
jgi:hypothetical protein